MKTSTLFAALSAAAMTLCTAAAAAQSVQSAPQAEAPAPGTPWSLDDCIGYALHNNVGVQQQALQVEQTDVKLSTSKYSRLPDPVSYTHLRAHETKANLVCRLLLEKKKKKKHIKDCNARTLSDETSSELT